MKSRSLLVALLIPVLFGAGCGKAYTAAKPGAKELREAAPAPTVTSKPPIPEGTEKIPLPKN